MASALHDFTDRIGRFFEANGLSRMAGRVLGHLLTCDPPEQTFDEVVAAVAASRSSVSVATQLLVQLGLIERFSVPKERRDRYRIRDDAWTTLLQQDVSTARQLRQFAEDGLRLVGSRPRAVSARLRAMKEFYVFLEQAYEPVLARWEKQRARAVPRRRSR